MVGCSIMTTIQELHEKMEILAKFQGFNGTSLQTLADETSPDVTIKMLTEFSKTVSAEVRNIEKGLGDQDRLILKKAFHKLAGSGELLGFPFHGRRWRELSHRLEKEETIPMEIPAELQEIKRLQAVLLEL